MATIICISADPENDQRAFARYIVPLVPQEVAPIYMSSVTSSALPMPFMVDAINVHFIQPSTIGTFCNTTIIDVFPSPSDDPLAPVDLCLVPAGKAKTLIPTDIVRQSSDMLAVVCFDSSVLVQHRVASLARAVAAFAPKIATDVAHIHRVLDQAASGYTPNAPPWTKPVFIAQ